MLRFPINKKPLCKNTTSTSWSLTLNDEWTLVCVWKKSKSSYELDYIYIRQGWCSEETFAVFGAFSFLENGQEIRAAEFFSELCRPEFRTKLVRGYGLSIMDENLHYNAIALCGVVNIMCLSKNCSSDFETAEYNQYIPLKSLMQFSNDFEKLLDQDTSCDADVTLKCGSDSIPVHKLILSVRSPVFLAMFKNPMKETHKSEVDITDIDASVVRAMVTYIYTGKASALGDVSVPDLLFAADKYQLLDLKRVCCDFLKESISFQNVMSIVILGDLYDSDLKSVGMDYIYKNYGNFSELKDMEEWKTLKNKRPALAMEVLEFLLKSKDQTK